MGYETLIDIGKVVLPLLTAGGQNKAGQGQQQADSFAAQQLRYNAGQENAVAQFSAEEKRRQTRLLMSRALAVAAAGGGSASDPTVLNLMAGIETEGRIAAMSDLYEGAARARGLNLEADTKDYEGRVASKAARLKASSTLLTGAKGIFDALDFGSLGGTTKTKTKTKANKLSADDFVKSATKVIKFA